MPAAEKRVQELLDRWLASVELHVQYLKLDDAAYARAQDWPRHQRPTKWVVELARTRVLELKANLARHTGDASFAESLELMSFLTSLLGSEHIERFIPLATGKPADTAVSATVEQPRLSSTGDKSGASARKPVAKRPAAKTAALAAAPTARATSATARPAPAPAAVPRTAAVPPQPSRTPPAPAAAAKPSLPASPAEQKAIRTVIADAVRFLEWGREWPALASQIARLADRPTEAEVRSILRVYKDEITRQSKRSLD